MKKITRQIDFGKKISIHTLRHSYGTHLLEAGVSLKATATEGGYLLNGAKTWCTFGGKAGVLMVLARTDADAKPAHKGLSMFLVEKPSTGGHAFEVVQDNGKLTGRAIATIGYRGMHSFELFFDDFFVPAENMLGGPEGEGKGFYAAMAGFAGGRIQTAARAVGVMRAAFERSISYSKERVVFGQSIGEYQLTQVKIARMDEQKGGDIIMQAGMVNGGKENAAASAAALFV